MAISCFGILYDEKDPNCQICSLRTLCRNVMEGSIEWTTALKFIEAANVTEEQKAEKNELIRHIRAEIKKRSSTEQSKAKKEEKSEMKATERVQTKPAPESLPLTKDEEEIISRVSEFAGNPIRIKKYVPRPNQVMILVIYPKFKMYVNRDGTVTLLKPNMKSIAKNVLPEEVKKYISF